MNSAVCFVVSYAINAAWQVPLLAGAGFAAAGVLRRRGPQAQHVVWVATLLLSSMTPLAAARMFLPAAISWGRSPGAGGASAAVAGSGARVASHAGGLLLPGGVIWLIFGLYVFALAWFAVRLLAAVAATNRLMRGGTPLRLTGDGERIWEYVRRPFAATNARLFASGSVRGIVTAGVREPAILLPADFVARWTEDDLLSALGHELAHVRRHDYAKNLLYEIAGLLTAFHPAIRIVKAQIARTREMVCDAMVVERLLDRKRYRQSLLRLAERMMPDGRVAANALGLFDANILEERIMMMKLKRTAPNRLVRVTLMGCATLLLLAAVIGGTAFAMGVSAPLADHTAGANKVYRVGPGITGPILTYAPDPEFPKSAMKEPKGFGVICVVGAVVTRDGQPENVHVIRSAGKGFDANAMKAVRQYRFRPALRHGKPVAVAIHIEVNFRKY
ncbi:MAG TPA: M56 family metallopeptidase [Acidobacteriaceae bacterium]|nr:M56 family metallopeptidase [Acidobacteriaceae bacterium]